jgi:uncharacterized protein (DUF2062 family)
MPNPEKVRTYAGVRMLGDLVQNPNLWHINRRSVARAFFIGFFVAFLPPMPVQMLVAAALSVLIHANLPLAAGLVWISNPLTWPFIYGLALKSGFALMGTPETLHQFEFSSQWLIDNGLSILMPYILGCLVCGTIAGILSYGLITWYWRRWVIKRWNLRRLRNQMDRIPD